MCGRCKACNAPLQESELCNKEKTGGYTDMCFACKQKLNWALYSIESDIEHNEFFKPGRRSAKVYDN